MPTKQLREYLIFTIFTFSINFLAIFLYSTHYIFQCNICTYRKHVTSYGGNDIITCYTLIVLYIFFSAPLIDNITKTTSTLPLPPRCRRWEDYYSATYGQHHYTLLEINFALLSSWILSLCYEVASKLFVLYQHTLGSLWPLPVNRIGILHARGWRLRSVIALCDNVRFAVYILVI